MKMMRITKKLCVCGFAFTFLAFCTNPSSLFAEATTHKLEQVKETFSDKELNEMLWETEDDVLYTQSGGALKIEKGTSNSTIGWKGLRDEGTLTENGIGAGLSGNYTLEFTVSMLETSWIGVFLGSTDAGSTFSQISKGGDKHASLLTFEGSGLKHYYGMSGTGADWNPTVDNNQFKGTQLTDDGTSYRIKMEATCECSEEAVASGSHESRNPLSTHKAKVSIARVDDLGRVGSFGVPVVAENVYTEGYFGFASINDNIVNISDIQVIQNGKTIYTPAEDTLTGEYPTIEYITTVGSPLYYDYEWRVWQSSTEDKRSMFYCGYYGKVILEDNEALTSKVVLSEDASVYSQYDVEFFVDFKELNGKAFALNRVVDEETHSAITFEESGEGRVVAKDAFGGQTETFDKMVKLSVQVKRNGKANVYANGRLVGVLRLSDVVGAYQFKSLAGQSVQLFNFSLLDYARTENLSPSVHTDFTLVDESTGRRYINTKELVLSGNAKAAKGYDEVSFLNAGIGSMLSTRQKYGEYVVKFDLVDIVQMSVDNIITFSFAKNEYTSTWKEAPTIIFVYRESGGVGKSNVEAVSGLSFRMKDGAEKTSATLTDNIFQDSRLAGYSRSGICLNVMLVVRNRTISLHYKYNNQPESVLATPRVVCYDVDTEGHFSIGGNNKANFSVRNFSLTNLEY